MAEMEPKKLAECLDYFRQRPVYEKLFQKFREKYASLDIWAEKWFCQDLLWKKSSS